MVVGASESRASRLVFPASKPLRAPFLHPLLKSPWAALRRPESVPKTCPQAVVLLDGFMRSVTLLFGAWGGWPITLAPVAARASHKVISDRNAKEKFAPVSARSVLDKVVSLPVTEWSYKSDADVRHIGPMAQDFHAAFDLDGADDKHIAVVDEAAWRWPPFRD